MERISSRQNELIRQVRRLYTSRSERQRTGLFMCDGFKLLEEACLWNVTIKALLVREDRKEDPRILHAIAERKVVLPASLFDSLCDVQTSTGVLFSCKMPEQTTWNSAEGCLILDGIQDPGNLGTILRTADALGKIQVCLTSDCVDPYNPKCVRATMGAIFRVPFFQMERSNIIIYCRERKIPLLVADLRENAQDLRQVSLRGSVIVIGSEGPGVSEAFRQAAAGAVVIPMQAGRESLNAAVAASILLWEMTK